MPTLDREGNSVIVGARVVFKIDAKKVGYASDVTVREDYQIEDVEVLDLLEVREHAVVGYRVSMTARIFRLPNRALKQQGIFPITSRVLTSGVLTATVTDKITGATLQQLEGVVPESKNVNFGARAVSGEDITFRAIRAKDEAEIAT